MSGAMLGIDVSNHQGQIDWELVAGYGVTFAYIKASEGSGFVDPYYDANFTNAKARGIYPGAYHYLRPSVPVAAQLDNFLRKVWRVSSGDLPPALDVEEMDGMTPAQVIAQVEAFRLRVLDVLGRDLLIYSYPYFWQRLLGDPHDWADTSPAWVATYGRRPMLYGGWPYQTVWQYTARGTVPGIAGYCDMDWFNGGADRLAAFAHVKGH